MITESQARDLVLQLGHDVPYVAYSCELSERGDYWVVLADAADYVIGGVWESSYVGVSAYLVHTGTGIVSTVGSAERWQDHIEDLHDLEVAAGAHYVLRPALASDDKQALIHLHRRLQCALPDAQRLLSPPVAAWFTGTRRALLRAQALLQAEGIATRLVLQSEVQGAVAIGLDDSAWQLLLARSQERIAT